MKVNNQFKFKQFSVSQDRCGMKVGTDGVLLGSWAFCSLPSSESCRLLDVGTGTGLLALMLAQRFPNSRIDALDIDADAVSQARENVSESGFENEINCKQISVQDFASETSPESYDAIISNPPFFVNSLKNPDSQRAAARHTDSLPFRDLFRCVHQLLKPSGIFAAVIPTEVLESFCAEGYLLGFYLSRRTLIKTVERKQPKRALVEFTRVRPESFCDEVCMLMDPDGNRSSWYQQLTDDFYVK